MKQNVLCKWRASIYCTPDGLLITISWTLYKQCIICKPPWTAGIAGHYLIITLNTFTVSCSTLMIHWLRHHQKTPAVQTILLYKSLAEWGHRASLAKLQFQGWTGTCVITATAKNGNNERDVAPNKGMHVHRTFKWQYNQQFDRNFRN